MRKSISGLLAGLLATGCAGSVKGVREARDVNFQIEQGVEKEQFTGKSDYTVVLFPNMHHSYGCQANLFLALESLVVSGDVKFVAREGKVGPTKQDDEAFQTKPYFDHQLEIQYYKDVIALPFPERKKIVHDWIHNGQYPSEFFHLFGEPVRDWNSVRPMYETVVLELLYQDKVDCFGVEDQTALEKANDVGLKHIQRNTGEVILEKLKDKEKKILIEERNIPLVENLHKHATEVNNGSLVPFAIGYWHIPDLTKRFKEKEISYQVIEYKSCTPEILEDIYGD